MAVKPYRKQGKKVYFEDSFSNQDITHREKVVSDQIEEIRKTTEILTVLKNELEAKAIEILKLRGANHQKKIVAFEITQEGIVVYPTQEVFGGIEEERGRM